MSAAMGRALNDDRQALYSSYHDWLVKIDTERLHHTPQQILGSMVVTITTVTSRFLVIFIFIFIY